MTEIEKRVAEALHRACREEFGTTWTTVVGVKFARAAIAAMAAAETPEPELPANFVKPEWWDAFWQSAARQINPQRPHGCICPPGAEATCQGWMCPRRAIGAPI